MLNGIKWFVSLLVEGILHCFPAAPNAWEQLTSRPSGKVEGFPQTLHDYALFNNLSHRPPLNALWLCEDTMYVAQSMIQYGFKLPV